jgi:hypothetical protein
MCAELAALLSMFSSLLAAALALAAAADDPDPFAFTANQAVTANSTRNR